MLLADYPESNWKNASRLRLEAERPFRDLIQQWRDSAAAEFQGGNTQYAQALDQCADDLSVVLSPQ